MGSLFQNYPGGPNVITGVLIRGKKKGQRQRRRHRGWRTVMAGLEGFVSQGVQETPHTGKGKETEALHPHPGPPEKSTTLLTS